MNTKARERIRDTFVNHKTNRREYGSVTDTIMNYALKTGYNIDIVRKERKMRNLV